MVNVLVIGSGAREHALAWKLAQSPRVSRVFVAPGNGGTGKEMKCKNLPLDINDHFAVLRSVEEQNVSLTIIGPEVPLVAGLADDLRDHGCLVFGPGREGAMIEGSKSWAKQFLLEEDIPTAGATICSNYHEACIAIAASKLPVVVKADGLAGGKGVFVCHTAMEAYAAASQLMIGNREDVVLIEEFLAGEEASLHIIVDEVTSLPMVTARDYKLAEDGDLGPNTGGMGAYAPVDDTRWLGEVLDRIVQPTLHGLRGRGITYQGVLYIGLMLTADGPKVLEFNCRFGDPETQVILPLLKSDFYELCLATARGELGRAPALQWRNDACVGVVLACEGYPETPKVGSIIADSLAKPRDDTSVFHAGTGYEDGVLRTTGGRVMTVVGIDGDLQGARQLVYREVQRFAFEHMIYRKDIAS